MSDHTMSMEEFRHKFGGALKEFERHFEIPSLTIIVNEQSRHYSLTGFEAFDRFMQQRDPFYRTAVLNAKRIGMSETDRLRYVLVSMAQRSALTKQAWEEHTARTGMPCPFVTKNPVSP